MTIVCAALILVLAVSQIRTVVLGKVVKSTDELNHLPQQQQNIAKLVLLKGGTIRVNKDKEIEWINLSGTEITDDDLSKLIVFPNLRRLRLERTQITDAGLIHLEKMHSLTFIRLPFSGKGLTMQGKFQLADALPDTLIRDRRVHDIRKLQPK